MKAIGSAVVFSFVIGLIAVCPPVHAATVLFTAQGTVKSVDPQLAPQISIGDPAAFTFSYDTSIPPVSPHRYDGAASAGYGTVGLYGFSVGTGSIIIGDSTSAFFDAFWGTYLISTMPVFGAPISGLPFLAVFLDLGDLSGTALPSSGLPESFDFNSFPDQHHLTLVFGVSNNGALVGSSASADINLTQFSAAETPLPAALPLFATGLGALGMLGWRRKRKVAAFAAP